MQNQKEGEWSHLQTGISATGGLTQQTRQKCDAKRPCTRCVTAHMASECIYEIVDAPPTLLNRPQFVFWDESGPSTSGDISSQESWAVGDTIAGTSTKTQVTGITITQSAIETVPPALTHPLGSNNTLSRTPKPRLLNQVEAHKLSPVIIPPFSALLSRIRPGIPPEPHITLLLLGAERFQLSDVALKELDLKLYVFQFY